MQDLEISICQNNQNKGCCVLQLYQHKSRHAGRFLYVLVYSECTAVAVKLRVPAFVCAHEFPLPNFLSLFRPARPVRLPAELAVAKYTHISKQSTTTDRVLLGQRGAGKRSKGEVRECLYGKRGGMENYMEGVHWTEGGGMAVVSPFVAQGQKKDILSFWPYSIDRVRVYQYADMWKRVRGKSRAKLKKHFYWYWCFCLIPFKLMSLNFDYIKWQPDG